MIKSLSYKLKANSKYLFRNYFTLNFIETTMSINLKSNKGDNFGYEIVSGNNENNNAELEDNTVLTESETSINEETLKQKGLRHWIKLPTKLTIIIPSFLIILLCLLLLLKSVYYTPHEKIHEVVPKESFETIDPINIKGNSDEAYAFFLCTRSDANPEQQRFFDALRVSIYRLIKMEENSEKKRDIIIISCQYNPTTQLRALKNLPVIVVPVLTINPPTTTDHYRWIDNYTKFHLWRFINWNRILYIDIDIFFMERFIDIWNEPGAQVIETAPPVNPIALI
jgi:alpha-N-acetylglucosamine transferase